MLVGSFVCAVPNTVAPSLPLPWLLYAIIPQDGEYKEVSVDSDGLGLSLGILILMVAVVVLSIMAQQWRMTKRLGYIMFALYGIFMAQALLRDPDIGV